MELSVRDEGVVAVDEDVPFSGGFECACEDVEHTRIVDYVRPRRGSRIYGPSLDHLVVDYGDLEDERPMVLEDVNAGISRIHCYRVAVQIDVDLLLR